VAHFEINADADLFGWIGVLVHLVIKPSIEPNSELPAAKTRSQNRKSKKSMFWFGSVSSFW
jgi:hypothetical protein